MQAPLISQLIRRQAIALQAYNEGRRVLSVYLGIDGTLMQTIAMVKSQWNSLRHQLSKRVQTGLAGDLARIDDYLDGLKQTPSRGLALFSAGDTLWRVIELPATPTPSIFTDFRPQLEPLLAQLRAGRTDVIAIVSRQKLRLLTADHGHLVEGPTLTTTDVPQRVKAIRTEGQMGRDNKLARHIDVHLRTFLERVVRALSRYQSTTQAQGLVLATHTELAGAIKSLLPVALKRKLLATIEADDDESIPVVRARYRAVLSAI